MNVALPENQKICPFMSGRPVSVNLPGVIKNPGGQGVSTMMVGCSREKCELWDGHFCSLSTKRLDEVLGNVAVGLTDVAEALKPFEAPLNGGPITRLVEVLGKLVDQLGRGKV